jgi:hypothetical protein
MDNDTDERSVINFPVRSLCLHDTRNPFQSSNPAEEQTARCPFLPHRRSSSIKGNEIKPSKSAAQEDVAAGAPRDSTNCSKDSRSLPFSPINIPGDSPSEVEVEADSNVGDQTASDTPVKTLGSELMGFRVPTIVPYQPEASRKLRELLRQIAGFVPAAQEELASHTIELRRLNGKCHRKTLILDIDETLILRLPRSKPLPDSKVSRGEVRQIVVTKPSGHKVEVSFIVRPHALNLLKVLKVFYEIIVL